MKLAVTPVVLSPFVPFREKLWVHFLRRAVRREVSKAGVSAPWDQALLLLHLAGGRALAGCLGCLPVCLFAWLPVCLAAWLSGWLHVCLLAWLPVWQPTWLPAGLPGTEMSGRALTSRSLRVEAQGLHGAMGR